MAKGDLKGTLEVFLASITDPTPAVGSVAVDVGDLVFVLVDQQANLTATAATDNLGNTYVDTNAGTDAGTTTGRAFYSRVTVAGTLTTINIDATASTNDVLVIASVHEGPIEVSPVDANPANVSGDLSSPLTCPATGTLAQSSELIMCWAVTNFGAGTHSATSPNLMAIHQSNTSVRASIGYQVVASTTTVAPEFTAGTVTSSILGTTSFKFAADAASPFSPNVWDNPRPSKPGQPLGYTAIPLALLRPSGAPVGEAHWPNPSVELTVAQALSSSSSRALLASLEIKAPFEPVDWPNPHRELAQQPTTNAGPGLALRSGQLPLPAETHPNPLPATPRQQPEANAEPSLSLKASQLPLPAVAQPNPLPGQRAQQPETNAEPSLPLKASQLPLPAETQPNPLPASRTQQPDTTVAPSLPLQALQAAQLPEAPHWWPNPADSAAQNVGVVVGSPRALLGSLVSAAPFEPIDWPNPRAVSAQQMQAPTSASLGLLASQLPLPAETQPNPAPPPPLRADFVAGCPRPLLSALAQPVPVRPIAWDNPLPVRAPQQPEISAEPAQGLQASQLPSVRQWDEPIPATAARVQPFVQSRNLLLGVPEPVRPILWPNPPIDTATQQPYLVPRSLALGGAPFRPIIWTNPETVDRTQPQLAERNRVLDGVSGAPVGRSHGPNPLIPPREPTLWSQLTNRMAFTLEFPQGGTPDDRTVGADGGSRLVLSLGGSRLVLAQGGSRIVEASSGAREIAP